MGGRKLCDQGLAELFELIAARAFVFSIEWAIFSLRMPKKGGHVLARRYFALPLKGDKEDAWVSSRPVGHDAMCAVDHRPTGSSFSFIHRLGGLPEVCFLLTHHQRLAHAIRKSVCRIEKVIPEVKDLVEDLRARGWRVVIVTASPAWIVEPGARRLGLGPEDVLGIEVRRDRKCWGEWYFF